MNAPICYTLKKNNFWLSYQKAIFWENENILIVSDLHLGKTGHFRKNGIAITTAIFQEDLHRLSNLIQFFKPATLLITGDMFHSSANEETGYFTQWRQQFAWLPIHLIKGNHDILTHRFYQQNDIQLHHQEYCIGSFIFRHDVSTLPTYETSLYCFSGHVHPGITLKTGSKQKLRLPCFYFGNQYAILPAFSRFTGLANITLQKDAVVYAIANQSVIQVR